MVGSEAGVFCLQKSFLSRPSQRHVWELEGSAEVRNSLQLCCLKAGLGKASETAPSQNSPDKAKLRL